MALRELDGGKQIYAVPHDDLVAEVLVPAMRSSLQFSCMVGFFNSAAFSFLAPGLAAFINESAGKMRLLASPLLEPADRQAMRDAVLSPEAVLERSAKLLFDGAKVSETALARHNYQCLAYLIAAHRLEIRFVLMPGGHLFHPKVWIFQDEVDLTLD